MSNVYCLTGDLDGGGQRQPLGFGLHLLTLFEIGFVVSAKCAKLPGV